jgi:DNA segregation ATPase FtsK/SpoIIIE-like protein
MDMRPLVLAEVKLINQLFAAHGIQAGTSAKRTLVVKSSFIAYGLKVAPGEKVGKIEAIGRELSNELTRQRVRLLRGYTGRAVARLRDYPLAIEVPHPSPIPLSWEAAPLRMGPFMGLVGRSYDYSGVREEYLDLDRHYHTLVAAMSGGGKSTLMRMALLTMALNTDPANLRMILVDLKNDDLVPFRTLPHVISYAGDIENATAAISRVHQVKAERIETQDKPYRLLLVIDELAELGAAKDSLKLLGSILSTGRSLGINVVAGTQYPTADSIGSVVNASFTVRLAGMVDSKTAALAATKRAASGAELLQTPGDFLRVDGAELRRMKAYALPQADTPSILQAIRHRWRGKEQSSFVIPPRQDEIDNIADVIAELWASGASKNAMSKQAFGKPYAGSYAVKIDQAIERLQNRASTTTDVLPSTHTSVEPIEASSSRSDDKIIRFPRIAAGD